MNLFPSLILATATIILNVPAVFALTSTEVSQLAKQFVVQIGGEDSGSGVIIPQNPNSYPVAQLENLKQEIEHWTGVLRLNPNDADAYVNRSAAYLNLGETHKALEDTNQAIRLDPNYGNPYYGRGVIYKTTGNKTQALAEFTKAAELFQQQGDQQRYLQTINQIRGLSN